MDVGGGLNWWIVVSLVAAWIIVLLCMIKGIASSGKVKCTIAMDKALYKRGIHVQSTLVISNSLISNNRLS